MERNTAIFYDIENLLKGYRSVEKMSDSLDIAEILKSIRKSNKIGEISLQKAYANWSDPRLTSIRIKISEIGIEPVHVFGFPRDQSKNISDIHLAVDCVDIANTRPHINVFVIVSGDGDFIPLVKKLHEYGKIVIGCSYISSANKIFRSLCDDFVWIYDADEIEQQNLLKSGYPEDPRNARLVSLISKATEFDLEVSVSKTREILKCYNDDLITQPDLFQNGIQLSVVQEAVKCFIPGFQLTSLGFGKFIEYMQFVCKETDFCVVRSPQPVVMLRRAVRSDADVLPDD